jgi:hypothetical protein
MLLENADVQLHFSNVCLTVKIWSAVDLPFQMQPWYSSVVSSA